VRLVSGLAPDPAVPRRDALLRPLTVAGVLSRRLLDGVPVDRCERVYAKYRFGESLRVVYRFTAGDAEHHVSARTFAPGATEARYRRALDGAVAAGPLPPVAHAPEIDAVLWSFPNDRRLTTLGVAPELGLRIAALRLVAYAAERSATFRCVDARGATLAYVKTPAGEAAATADVAARLGTDHPYLRVPRVLGATASYVALEPLAGRRLGSDLHGLGTALATLHHTIPVPPERFTRLEPGRLATAATVVARARPDAAGAAERLLARLSVHADDAEREPVCLHGDANLRNALALPDGRIALIDLEHLAAGPAAADLGQVLAGLLTTGGGRAAAASLLAGYAMVAAPPDRAALRWHTAACLLARCALPAVGRVRPDTLGRLRALMDAATTLVAAPAGVSA
jgi:aminoglycoside phosphotransferase (APT) family kinase protein